MRTYAQALASFRRKANKDDTKFLQKIVIGRCAICGEKVVVSFGKMHIYPHLVTCNQMCCQRTALDNSRARMCAAENSANNFENFGYAPTD